MPYPVALFAYNRPVHTARALEALVACRLAKDTELIAFSDGPRHEADEPRVREVRTILGRVNGFRSVRIVPRERNLGLACSVLTGVSEVLADHSALIVLEDDLLPGPHFLSFLNAVLDAYVSDTRILSAAASVPWMPGGVPVRTDVWLSPRPVSYGWATWRDRWFSVDWEVGDYEIFAADPRQRAAFARGGPDLPAALDAWKRGDIDSWAIRFAYAHFRQGRFALLPRFSHIRHIGFDGSGTHCGWNPLRQWENNHRAVANPRLPMDLKPSRRAWRRHWLAFALQHLGARMRKSVSSWRAESGRGSW